MLTTSLSTTEFCLRLLLALAMGAVIGMERQWRHRMAGLRTNVLVASGAALYIMLTDSGPISGDGTRIAAQIVSGVGFLGAGVIMKEGASIRGLNTAATIWCSSAVGCFAGIGQYSKSFIAAGAVLFANLILRPLAQKINAVPHVETDEEVQYFIRAKCRNKDEVHIRHQILQMITSAPSLVLKSIESNDIEGTTSVLVSANVETVGKQHNLLEGLMSRLGVEPGIIGLSWQQKRADESI